MSLPAQQQAKYWGIAAAVFFITLWYLGNTLLPFFVGAAVAYFLDPVADWLEAHGLSRVMATVVITLCAVLVFVVAALIIVPTMAEQAVNLFKTAPDIMEKLKTSLTSRFPEMVASGSPVHNALTSAGQTIQEKGGELLQGVLSSAASLLNIAMFFVVVPVVSFYLLLDWDNMIAKIDELLPRDHAPVIRKIFGDIDATLASFVRGQGTVCLILGTYYAVSLMIVGLNFGLVVGFIAGLVSFIPYVGAIVGGVLSIGLALFQFWGDWWMIAAVFAVFQVGQILEGNVLTPMLIGNSVGLHPVWLILALSVFGSIFGFIGLLVAVPLAASLGVVIRYIASQYKDSRLYKGLTGRDAP
ncbi:AI-2E family transporter [Donghicola sp. C2-DW-16]|uniref:AI-2E family transporter n=1 Tax=Donghicola mangrovi TaxID=2729614 RepID=A0A850Q2T6_9RHOB|nr:AI-2E family transporter [Donghicola mangrovi]NVO23416.1 AI-2E family transporter [Donghicola mangrovi]NVO27126.1 AI-2E family transporter [Donghicola mangrovi]